MTNTEVMDFDPEFTAVIPGTHYSVTDHHTSRCTITVHIAKVGGGTVGSSYGGRWMYLITTETGVIGAGDDFNAGIDLTHGDTAALVISFFEDEDETCIAGINITRCDKCGAPLSDGGTCIAEGLHEDCIEV